MSRILNEQTRSLVSLTAQRWRFAATSLAFGSTGLSAADVLVEIGNVDIRELVEWIGGIPFEEWPQQNRLSDGRLRPAMVSDLDWYGFGKMTDVIVAELADRVDARASFGRMLSVVMPGADIQPHSDNHGPGVLRIHVPLLSNERATFVQAGSEHVLLPGKAYQLDTLVEHAVVNGGETPRIHLMFDVR